MPEIALPERHDNPFVITSFWSCLQAIADAARYGYVLWIGGIIEPHKAGALAEKFHRLYEWDSEHTKIYRMRKSGRSVARLIIYGPERDTATGDLLPPSAATLRWLLMRTEGTLPPDVAAAAARERWARADTPEGRIVLPVMGWGGGERWSARLELVRHTRPGAMKPSWTWRVCRDDDQMIRDWIVHAVRTGHDHVVKEFMAWAYRALPGFALVRQSVKKWRSLILSEYKRRRGEVPAGIVPDRMPAYARRRAITGLPLDAYLAGGRRRGRRRTPRQETVQEVQERVQEEVQVPPPTLPRYEIRPRQQQDGWQLRLFDADGVEAGGGVFPGEDGFVEAQEEGEAWLETKKMPDA